MFRKIMIFIFLPVVSILIVSATGFNTFVENGEEFRNAKFGFPFPFITQDLEASGASEYEGGFPDVYELQMDFLDHDPEMEFDLTNYILSCITFYVCLAAFLKAFSFFLLKVTKVNE
ncbi:hypothetical protein RRU94_02415 [Domibacillus sp. DTU_2020_1001157_1_SI_ALB_TIR_016]|uniref:hypothetical protein n=1 Tax=Domibacillus sp. DTU_2020_1001157_1_SI_ALB_TIR_016 TaxID=3077789 RepID=UPI0028EB5B92|nr:hypothetical protein [Domibacillus sp. DTU_2020_1001157_1_SI_ALB_TIR_016]WNS78818.1 hypothetical protein RRU94_02415 [Domibacillus sp. DTU_2020_1001157_1_SI_ALB_TIR_016]